MAFDVTYTLDNEVLIITLSGKLTGGDGKAMGQRIIDIITEQGICRVLVDSRQLEGRASFTDTYYIVRELPVGRKVRARTRLAVLEIEANRGYAEFQKATNANAGATITHFYDYDEALAWLRQ